MKYVTSTICLCLLVATFANAQERNIPELEVLLKQYAADVQLGAGAKYQSAFTELNQKYAAALERALKAAQDGGGLEAALALKNEATLISGGGSVPISDEGAPAALKNLRVVYRQSAARLEQEKNAVAAPLTKALAISLDQLVATLTKAGRLEDALSVKQKKDSLSAEVGTPAALAGASLVSGQKAFTNTLGMKFVPVLGTKVLFCIHETRKADYAAYAAENSEADGSWKNQRKDGIPAGADDSHPVVGVCWADSKAFCDWLSKKEGRSYRLPTDREWSYAVGIARNEKKDSTPDSLNGKIADEFPWGSKWPPTKGSGNFADATYKQKFPSADCIEGYTDGFVSTAPVMSFQPNKLGIYDLGGNVWEWCDDWYSPAKVDRVSRGGSWTSRVEGTILSTHRDHTPPNRRDASFGFRCVVEAAP